MKCQVCLKEKAVQGLFCNTCYDEMNTLIEKTEIIGGDVNEKLTQFVLTKQGLYS